MDALLRLGAAAAAAQQQQIAFLCFVLAHDFNACVDLLLAAGRAPEASLFAKTYCPSLMDKAVAAWRETRAAAAPAAAAAATGAKDKQMVQEHEVLQAYIHDILKYNKCYF